MNEEELMLKLNEKEAPEPDFSKIRVLAIDLDNTLLDFDLCARESIQKGFEEWNLPYSEEVTDIFLRINNRLWTDIEYGRLTVEELKKIRWNQIFATLGWENLDGPAFENTFRKYLHDSHEPVEGAIEAIERLSPVYEMMIVTNGAKEQQVNRISRSGLSSRFFELLTSEEAGIKKPGPAFYEQMFERIRKRFPQIEKDEILVIGDSLHADVYGAIQSGFPVLWFQKEDIAPAEPGLADSLKSVNWTDVSRKLLSERPQTELAEKIARKAHKDQIDKAGLPYILHPQTVAASVNDPVLKAAAWMHDVIEDTDVTADDLRRAGIQDEIVDLVLTLTRTKPESYQEYLNRIKQNPKAVQVKLADLSHNSQMSRLKNPTEEDYARLQNYQNAKKFLTEE